MQSLMDGRERHFELDKRWNAGTPEAPEWLIFNGHAICELDSDGKPAYIVNAIHNVTQEMEEEQAARNLIHKYQVLSNAPFVALSFYDKDGFLSELNDNMKDLCGMDTDHDAQRFWETVNMFDVPIFRGVCEQGFREDRFFCQHMLYPEFDIDKHIECSIQPLFNAEGDVISYLIMAFDISQDRQRGKEIQLLKSACRNTNEQIRLQHERLAYLLLHSERYIMHSDTEKEQISFSRTPDKPEYAHSFSRFQRMLAEEDRDAFMDILYDNTTKTPTSRVIHLIQTSKGQPGVVFNITFNPVINENGEITGYEGIASDITRISNTRQQLVEETRRAEDSVRMKSAFMASMTHELRTPLNAIVGFTSVLEALGDSPERAEYVRIIRNSSDMLQRLINDIIEASSMDAGALSIEPRPIDFAKEFEDICITLAQRVQNPDVEFQKENPYEHLYTTLDIERIQQILNNFITNAVKFTTEGHIKLGYQYQDGELYLFCEDTGKGIPPEKQASVFERFVKLDEFVQGTGMGLAISKSIAERCGGKIGVNSEGEDKGSTFWVRIPCEKRNEI